MRTCARHPVASSALVSSRSPTCTVAGGGGGGGGAVPAGPWNRSIENGPPLPRFGSPENGVTRIVYVPARVGIQCRVSWRPTLHSVPAAQVLSVTANPVGSKSCASRSGLHSYIRQPRGPRSRVQMAEPSIVIVAAIGTPRSPGASVKDGFDTTESATERVKCWYAGKGVVPDPPAAAATAAYASSRPDPHSSSFPAGPTSRAVVARSLRTSVCVHAGCFCRSRAATPDT